MHDGAELPQPGTDWECRHENIAGVAAFWRNDQDAGVSICLDFASGGGDAFADAVRQAMPSFDASATPERCMAWLAEVAGRKDQLSEVEILDVVACISWLEQRGDLLPDEFNGVIWFARRAGELVALSCKS